ncbi:MAG: AAA family ATPase [Chloroflexus sp.]
MSKYQLLISHSFLNELLDLPLKIQKSVTQKIKLLERDPISAQGDAKKLHYDDPPLYRMRIGDYRLIYSFGKGWVKIVTIRKRDDQTYQRDFGDIDIPSEDLAENVYFQHSADNISALNAVSAPPEVALSSQLQARMTADSPSAQPTTNPPDQLSQRPLSRQLTPDELQRWQIPAQFWPTLLAVQTEDDLLAAPVPVQIIERVLDILYPRQVTEILQQPQLLLNEAEDLDRFVVGELTDFLLMLDPDQQQLVQTPLDRPILVRGGPGSGKSIVALYRVQRLVAEGYTPVLFTTFTNTLIAYSTQLLERLLKSDLAATGVEVNTVDSLIFRQYVRAYGKPRLASEEEIRAALDEAMTTTPMPAATKAEQQRQRATLMALGHEYLLDECINVIEHWGLTELAEYLVQPRIGRQIALRASTRRAVWAIYDAWRTILHRNGLTTWGQVRQQALALAQQRPDRVYRAIVIDEAQDLSPVALRYLLACVDSPRAIYLTADARQSLYQRGFSWQQISHTLNMRGRSFVLRRNYRNTSQIATACSAILGADSESDQATAIHSGERPIVRFCRHIDEEAIAIRDFFIAAARRWRLPAHAGAVLCHSRQVAQQICERLQQVGMPAELMERKQIDLRKPVVKVMTIHSAKGLEFPFVAVMRLEEGHFPHTFEQLPVAEQDAMIAQERRLFYVGCSRAMRALLVCASIDRPSPFALELAPDIWQYVGI